MSSFGLIGSLGKDGHVARLRALGVALVVAGLLGATAACEDEPEPDIADPTTSAPTPTETTPSPSPTPTEEPLTPEETVRAWVDAWNGALRTGEVSTLQSLAAQDCRNCENYVATIRDVYTSGGEFSGGEWSVVELSAEENTSGETRVVVGMSVAAGSTINAAGEEPVAFEAQRRGVVYTLGREDEGWLIVAIDLLS